MAKEGKKVLCEVWVTRLLLEVTLFALRITLGVRRPLFFLVVYVVFLLVASLRVVIRLAIPREKQVRF